MPAIFIRVGSWWRKASSSFFVYERIGLAGSTRPDSV